MKPVQTALSMLLAFLLLPLVAALAQSPSEAGALKAFDIPGDNGRAIGLSWPVSPEASPEREYAIYRGASPEGPFEEIDRFPEMRLVTVRGEQVPHINRTRAEFPKYFGFSKEMEAVHFIPINVVFDGEEQIQHYYRVALIEQGRETLLTGAVTARAIPNWFAWHRLNNLILMLVLCGSVLFFIEWAKRNPNLFIRRLTGLEALDEAVGRATEMGKPIMYTTGYHDMDRVSTIASVNILQHVARKVAEYDTRMIVPCKWSVAMTVCQEVVKEAYTNAGRPDAYNPHDIYYVAGEQFSWTAAVDGIIVREKPAANFLLGTFAAEALILAETGASTGAIQISGTDSSYQIPFFVVACDYCLIGEELYAASAYLSREPKLLGSLKGQDAGKAILLTVLVLGNLSLLCYELFGGGEIFLWIKHFFTQL